MQNEITPDDAHPSSAGIQYLGPVSTVDMVRIVDADEPRSTIIPSFREAIEQRLKRAALGVLGYPAYGPIIRAFNDEGFRIMDQASGSEARA